MTITVTDWSRTSEGEHIEKQEEWVSGWVSEPAMHQGTNSKTAKGHITHYPDGWTRHAIGNTQKVCFQVLLGEHKPNEIQPHHFTPRYQFLLKAGSGQKCP